MNFEESLNLPAKQEGESTIFVEENREMDNRKKKRLKKQSEFEFREVEGREVAKVEEEKEQKKDLLFRWVVGAISFLFLVGLYFLLLY